MTSRQSQSRDWDVTPCVAVCNGRQASPNAIMIRMYNPILIRGNGWLDNIPKASKLLPKQ